jgi:hypothetical protein
VNEGENTNRENSEDEHVPQDKDKKHKTKKEKSRRRKEEKNKEERRDDEENGDDANSGESQESDVRGEKHVRRAVEGEEGSKNERREKERGQRKDEVCAWHRGRRMRIINIYDQNIKKNAPGKQRGILEIENWNEIIDNNTILAGDFNAHDPLWGSHKTKDSSHIKNFIEQYELKICKNFQSTRMGYDNQQPSIIDLTLTAGPTLKQLDNAY